MFNRAKDDSDDGEATGDRPVPPPPGAGDDSPTDHEADTVSPADDPADNPADDPADDAGDASAPEPTGGRSEVEALLRRLEDVARHGGDARTPDFHRVTGAADQHAEALSATVTARREAERLLTLATQERDEAAEAAARILEEARESAARLEQESAAYTQEAMAETQQWAAEQRESIGEVVAELTAAARRDAEQVRVQTLEQAMEEARHAARTYVARAAAIGSRDAERHRADAAAALETATSSVSAVHATVQEFAAAMSAFVTSMDTHLEDLRSVTEQVTAQHGAAIGRPDIAVDTDAWLDEHVETPMIGAPTVPPTADAAGDPAGDPAGDTKQDDADDETGRTGPGTGHPLGALFRDPGWP